MDCFIPFVMSVLERAGKSNKMAAAQRKTERIYVKNDMVETVLLTCANKGDIDSCLT